MQEHDTHLVDQLPTATVFLERQLDNLAIESFKARSRTLPASKENYEIKTPFRIALFALDTERPPMLLNLMGSIKLGHSSPSVDIDLTIWGAQEQGVSREHLLLRPGTNSLWAIDLSSTNNSYINGLPLSPARAHKLRDKDVITLGKLHLGLHLL